MQMKRIVTILKEANIHFNLLDDFQQSVVLDRTQAYRKYGESTRLTEKQSEVFEEIASKLFLDQES